MARVVNDANLPRNAADDQCLGQRTLAALAGASATGPESKRRGAVRDDGAFVGSVSGGCVEGAVIEEARAAMNDRQTRKFEFGVSDEQAWAVGLACGGRIEILVEPVSA